MSGLPEFESYIIRLFVATDEKVVFLKFPLKNQPKKPSFPFVYEYSAIRQSRKPGSYIFESLLKANKRDALRVHKKHYPRLLSFYDLLENDFEYLYAVHFVAAERKVVKSVRNVQAANEPAQNVTSVTDLTTPVTDNATADRRSKLTASQLEVS